MRELKRKKRIYEQLKVGDEVLQINIDPTAMLPEYNRAKDALLVAQAVAQSGAEADLAQFGQAVVDMMEILLGKENAAIIMEFYEDDYIEMLEEVLPYLNEVIVPQMTKAAEDKKKEYRKKYGKR